VPKAVNRSGCAINTTAHSAIRSRDLAHCSQACYRYTTATWFYNVDGEMEMLRGRKFERKRRKVIKMTWKYTEVLGSASTVA